MILNKLEAENLIHPPSFLVDNTQMLVRVGSIAYALTQDSSDEDLIGFCIPTKRILFPQVHDGVIPGFGYQGQAFEQYQKHKIKRGDKEYDINVYNITKYFDLLLKGNPSLIESLFVHRKHILTITQIGELIRENRHKFLSKQMCWKIRAYASSQFTKMTEKQPIGKRKEAFDLLGYCPKFASHSLRLLFEAEDILLTGDLDLEKNSQTLLVVKKGQWKIEDIQELIQTKTKEIEKLIPNASLQAEANEKEIKELLIRCLEMHYGNLDREIAKEDAYVNALKEVRTILKNVGL